MQNELTACRLRNVTMILLCMPGCLAIMTQDMKRRMLLSREPASSAAPKAVETPTPAQPSEPAPAPASPGNVGATMTLPDHPVEPNPPAVVVSNPDPSGPLPVPTPVRNSPELPSLPAAESDDEMDDGAFQMLLRSVVLAADNAWF